jgi:uncharacterized membrane protein YcaP (DUF421 family)
MGETIGRMFYNGWHGPLRVVLVGTLAYAALIVLLRVSGKRTLSKLNAFDLVVTVSLGSTLATILLSRDVALVEGVVALTLLIGLQFVVTWLSVRSARFGGLVKADPMLLFFRGQFLRAAMRRARVTEDEVLAAVRENRFASLDEVEAVVLETAATLTVLRRPAGPVDPRSSALRDVADASPANDQ